MKKKSNLIVRPLRRYPAPRYPSHTDPNPLDHPASLPYPFSQRVLSWALATGLVTGAGTLSSQTPSPAENAPHNPFTLPNIGLPYMPISFGTGLPDRLDEKEIRTAIENGFSAEGITLQKQQVWQGKMGEIVLDGYNADTKIGYVILGYRRLGEGTIKGSGRRSLSTHLDPQELSPLEVSINAEYQTALNNQFKSGEYWMKVLPANISPERKHLYEGMYKSGKAGEGIDKRLFTDFYLETRYLSHPDGYAQPVLALLQAIVATPKKGNHDALLEDLFEINRQGLFIRKPPIASLIGAVDTLTNIAFDLVKNEGGQQQQSHLAAIKVLTTASLEVPYFPNQDRLIALFQRTAKRLQEQRDWTALRDALKEYQAAKADMEEIREMLGDADEKKQFIIPISYHEAQTIVKPSYPEIGKMPDEISKDAAKREEWYRTQQTKAHEKALAEAMQRLENDVRVYIQWAKSQGRY